jgi:hypothetical protein
MHVPPFAAAAIACFFFVCPESGRATDADTPSATSTESKVALTFSGGHDTEGVDRGRPVILVASALNVPPEVFREAFTHVKPAGPGQHPEEAQVRLNKQALMERLGPLGVTDDRLNEVSNYYRYRRDSGELWRHVDAQGYATLQNGVVTSVTITNPGAGYSSLPTVSVPGVPNVFLTPTLSFGTDLPTNGSISKITIEPITN